MYFPIPESTLATNEVTLNVPATECNSATSLSKSVTFSKPKSSVPREKTPNVVVNVVNRPIEGSWRKIRDSGQIKMTEMSIVKETHEFLVAGVQVPYFKAELLHEGRDAAKIGGLCYPCVRPVWYGSKVAYVQGRYTEQGDLAYWKERYPSAPHFKCVDWIDPSEIEAAKTEVFSELFTAYNLGEELAEFRETISGVTKLTKEAISLILNFRKTITQLLEKGLKKEAASRWMEFRYGIMPIMYSIQDILKLSKESGVYRTARQKVKPKSDESPEFGQYMVYFEDVGVSEVRCSVTAKGRWASSEMKMLDLISINPLTTLVEVYPWAMVIGWFFNVSAYVNTRAKSLTSLALETSACVAVREKKEYGTYLYHQAGYDQMVYDPGNSSCGSGFYGNHDHGPYFDTCVNYVKLCQYSIDNYNRYLFTPSDVKIVWNPYFDWRRIVDGCIIGSGQLSKLLRGLK